MSSYAASSGLGGAVSGAALGATIGGIGGATIGCALGLVSGIINGSKAAKATEAYNNLVVQNTTQSLFDLRRQQNVSNMQTAQALASIQDSSKVQTSSYNAQYGAADVIGAGADTMKQVLAYQANQATAGTWINFNTSVENYNTQVNSTVANAEAKLKSSSSGGASTSPTSLASLVSTGISAYKGLGGGSSVGTFNSEGSYTNQLFGQSYGDTGVSNQGLWSSYSNIGVY